MQPRSEAHEAGDRCFRVSVARRLMLPNPAVPTLQMWYSLAQTKVRRVSSATNQWIRNSTTAADVVTEEVLTAGMQQW